MARGWIAGLLTGIVVAGLGLGVVSLMMGPVAPIGEPAVPAAVTPTPEPAADPAPADPEPAPAVETPAPAAPVAETPVEPQDEAPVAADEPAGAADAPATTPAEPDAPEADTAPAAPDIDEPADTATPDAAAPDATDPQSAPADDLAPDTDETTSLDEPADTAAPDTVASAEQTDADAAPASAPVAEPAEDMAAAAAPADDAAAPANDVAAAPADDVAAAPAAPVADASDVGAGAPEPAPASAMTAPEPETDETAGEPATVALDDGPAVAEPEAEAEEAPRASLPQIVVEPAPGAEAPATAEPRMVTVAPEADLTPEIDADPAAAVVTNRLPRIGDAPAVAAAPVAAAAATPALLRNALAFAPVGDQPRLAILLIDTGPESRTQIGNLGQLPFPVTVAVDASAVDAEQALAFYRDQGAEVVLEVPLPTGATPTDVDVTVEAYAPLLEDVVAVMTEPDLDFQALGDGAVQLATNLAESGHGLVSYPAGLNTGHKSAIKAGVKAGLVFRDLDSEGQDGTVIRRFLDNAAFRARNEEGVIVVGRTRPETVQALLEWSLGTRAQSVALAPVSAVLAGD